MKFQDLIAAVPDVIETRLASNPDITGVCEDSRRIQPGNLFVARPGSKTSGTTFINDAVNAGAVAVVSDKPIALPDHVAFIQVANANAALALLAHKIQDNPTRSMKMLAITGTKGKTTVAYLLRSVLKAAGKKVGMIGTVEIDDGKVTTPAEMTTPSATELVDLFSRMKTNGVEYCVLEVSSHALHQHRVAGIDFQVAIFTNLTGDHLDYHKTMEEYAAAKAILFENLKPSAIAIINADDKYAGRMAVGCRATVIPYRVGHGEPDKGWLAEMVAMTGESMRLVVHGQRGGIPFCCEMSTALIGRHNAYNLLSVIAAAESLGLDLSRARITSKLLGSTGAPGRLQPVVPPGRYRAALPFQVFVDYAHTHDALENVLRTLRSVIESTSEGVQSQTRAAQTFIEDPATNDSERKSARQFINRTAALKPGRLICLFGCGGDRDRTKRPKMAKVAEMLAHLVIVTSDNPRTEDPNAIIEEICAGFSPDWKSAGKITVEPDRRSAIQQAIALAQPGDVVLIAGKGHENYQIIGKTKHHFDDVEEALAALQTNAGKKNI